MRTYLDFDIIAYPDTDAVSEKLTGEGARRILVAFMTTEADLEEEKSYLYNVLEAAKLSPIERNVWLLPLPADAGCRLAELCRQLGVQTVLLFGLAPERIGLRAELPPYTPIRLADCTWLSADRLLTIQQARQKGNNQAAGALWAALKQLFL